MNIHIKSNIHVIYHFTENLIITHKNCLKQAERFDEVNFVKPKS